MTVDASPHQIYLDVARALREQIFEMRARSMVQERILVDLLARQIAIDPDSVRALLTDIQVNLPGGGDDVDPDHADRVRKCFAALTSAADRRALLLTMAQPDQPTGPVSRVGSAFRALWRKQAAPPLGPRNS